MSWYQIEVVGKHRYRLWVKWWHPGFWAEGYRMIRASGAGILESVYYTLVLIFQMARCKR